jgi:hypothetical protein
MTVLSDGQVRFWLDDQLRPQNAPANVMLHAFRMAGPVEAEAVWRAVRTVVGRHDALRTGIGMDDQGVPVPVPLTVAAALRRELPGTELATLLDLECGPLVAVRVEPVPEGVTLALAVHHAACDAHSIALIAREMSALIAGRELPPAPSYRDHAARRQSALGSGELDAVIDRWATEIGDAADVRWRMRPDDGGEGEVPVGLSDADNKAMDEFARASRVTPYAVALTAYARALRQVIEPGPFCIGVPMSIRDRADEQTVGLFVNPVPLPFAAVDDEPPQRAVRRSALTVVRALQASRAPFDRVIRRLGRRGTGRHPVFQAQFAWLDVPVVWDIPGVEVEEIRLVPLRPQLELTLELFRPPAGRTAGILEHSSPVGARLAADVSDAFVRAVTEICTSH